MDLDHLGHAMWLIDAAGLRLLFDPLLDPTHHGGVYGVRPAREVDEAALRADFIFISHRHTDHFDPPSLARLAALDADSVVLTPDPLVAWAARELGFRSVREIPIHQRVELDRVRFVTTPSTLAGEWGVLIEEDRGPLVWNQVDTGFPNAAALREAMGVALRALGRDPEVGPDLGLVRWQPMLEIAAPTCGRIGFPHHGYARMLEDVVALRAGALVPGACGAGRVGPFAWMDAHAYPVSEARFLTDLAALLPSTPAFPARVGGRYRVDGGGTHFEPTPDAALATVSTDELQGAPALHPATYAPFSIPPLTDPERSAAPLEEQRRVTRGWIEHDLARGLARAWPQMNAEPLTLALDIEFPTSTESYTIHVDGSGATVTPEHRPEWDVYNAVPGSLLHEVVEGRYAWGDVLLGGMLRACDRTYRVDAEGLSRTRVGLIFLYYGLGYDEAFERSIRWQVAQLTGR